MLTKLMFVFFPVHPVWVRNVFLYLMLHKLVIFTMGSFISGTLYWAPVSGSKESGVPIVRVWRAGDAFKCDATKFYWEHFLLSSVGNDGSFEETSKHLNAAILMKTLFSFFCLSSDWYHDPSSPNSFGGITGSSVHLRPHQRQKLPLSLSLSNPSLALFYRGNPFQQLCPLSYLLGNPCQADQIVTTAMKRCLANRLAAENSKRCTLSPHSRVKFSIAEAERLSCCEQ